MQTEIEPIDLTLHFEIYLSFLKDAMLAGSEPISRYEELVGPGGAKYLERWSRKQASGSFIRHARRGTDIVGFIEAQTTADGSGLIGLLHVRQDVRRQGLARRMEAAALGHFEQLGVHIVRLNVTEENRNARAYYEAMGWRLEGPSRYAGALSYRKDLPGPV